MDLSALMAQQLALDRAAERRAKVVWTPGITVPQTPPAGEAVGNLLSNASRYSPEAEMGLVRPVGGPPALVRHRSADRGVPCPTCLKPFTGRGFEPETGGSGLGLYLVKMILARPVCTIENTEDGVKATVRF
ncbi:MAG: hypothetical protein ACLTYN_12480 [Dysosmobacter welbionis]